MSSLTSKKLEFTKNLIIETACKLTETLEVSELSFKKVAAKAGMSERTMFRYFRTRDDFLDALTARLLSQLQLPDTPTRVDDLSAYASDMFRQIEAQPRQVLVLLSSELLPRVYATSAKTRLEELTALLATTYPKCPQPELIRTAANLRYMLSATSWRHYRTHFNFDLETCIACAQLVVTQSLNHLAQLSAKG